MIERTSPAAVRRRHAHLAAAKSSGGQTVKPTLRNYFIAFLRGLGMPVTTANLRALYGVATLEGYNDRYNPLNVIQPEPGSTAYNSVGVQRYADFNTGVKGAVTLFRGEHWNGVRAALARGSNEDDVLAAFRAAYTWDPGVQFPHGTPGEARVIVGPHPGTSSGLPTGTAAGFSGGAAGFKFPGGNLDPLNWPGAIVGAGASAAGGVAGGILKVALPFMTKATFLVGGLALVVVGLHRATQPAREKAASTAASVAPLL